MTGSKEQAIGTVCTWCGRVVPHHKPGCMATRGARPRAIAPEVMNRATLEAEVKRLYALERDVRMIMLMPEIDLRHKLAELDAEAERIARELTLENTVRALLEYALAGVR